MDMLKAKRATRAVIFSAVVTASCLVGCSPVNRVSQNDGHYIRPRQSERVLIFVHGLWGDAKSTWTAPNNAYWPKLVADDKTFSGSDIYVAHYDTRLSGRLDLSDLANNLFERLTSDEVFDNHKQIVFIAHSLGGLVVQSLLVTHRDLASKVPLLIFYAVPQDGSDLARLGKVVLNDPAVAALGSWEEVLKRDEDVWRSDPLLRAIPIECVTETQPYNNILIVEDRSGTRNCTGQARRINRDHFAVVKPVGDRDDPATMLQNIWKQRIRMPAKTGQAIESAREGAVASGGRGAARDEKATPLAEPSKETTEKAVPPNRSRSSSRTQAENLSSDRPRTVDKFDGFTMTVEKCERSGPDVACDFVLRNSGETRNFRIHNGPTFVLDSGRQQRRATVTVIGDSRNDASYWMAQTDVPAGAEMAASASFGPISANATSLQTVSVNVQWSANGKGGTRNAIFEKIPINQ